MGGKKRTRIETSDGKSAIALIGEKELAFLTEHCWDAKIVIEIGCWQGATTKMLADAVSKSGLVIAVDPWHREYTAQAYEVFKRFMEYEISTGKVQVVRYPSAKAFNSLQHLTDKVDLVYIDGEHRYGAVLNDINNYYQLVRPHGIICGDDFNYPSVEKAVRKFFGDNFDVVGQLWWAMK